MQILKIKKRNWLACLLGVDHWLVDVVTDDGAVIKLKCWASINKPSKISLIYDIERQLKDLEPQPEDNPEWDNFLEEYK